MNKEFRHYYPHADLTKFDISDKYGVSFNYKGMGYDVFEDGPSGRLYYYLDNEVEMAMIKALGPRVSKEGVATYDSFRPRRPQHKANPKPILSSTSSRRDGGVHKTPKPIHKSTFNFPPEFLLADVTYSPQDFSKDIEKLDFDNLEIYMDPKNSFTVGLDPIFIKTVAQYDKEKTHRWFSGLSNLSLWSELISFVVWCSTAGCGVAQDMLSRKDYVGGFLRFHVAFTVHRLLFELSCPKVNDEVFNPIEVNYNKDVLERIKKEFKPIKDFRYTHGHNGGLGDIYGTDGKKAQISWGSMKPEPWTEERNNKYPGGSYDFDSPYQPIGFLSNPLSKDAWRYFIPAKGKGLTVPGKNKS